MVLYQIEFSRKLIANSGTCHRRFNNGSSQDSTLLQPSHALMDLKNSVGLSNSTAFGSEIIASSMLWKTIAYLSLWSK